MKFAVGLWVGMVLLNSVHALYSGNPDEAELLDGGLFLPRDDSFGVKLGYQGDLVFDRKMHATSGVQGDVDTFESRMNQAVLSVNFMNRLELFGSAGSMKAYLSFRPNEEGKRREFQTHEQFTWGGGGRALLLNWGNAHVGASGSYQYAKLPINWDAVNGETFSSHATMKYWEWQAAGLIAYRVEIFDPYAGVSYSSAEAILYHIGEDLHLHHKRVKMKNRERIGLILGCSLTASRVVDLNIEVRLFDEEAVSIAGNMKF